MSKFKDFMARRRFLVLAIALLVMSYATPVDCPEAGVTLGVAAMVSLLIDMKIRSKSSEEG